MDGAEAAKYVLENNIEGAFVECGVESGDFEIRWIKELMHEMHRHNPNRYRDIYLFDTFQGLTKPGEFDYTCKNATIYKMDKDQVHAEWEKRIIDVNKNLNGWCYCSLDSVKSRLDNTGYPEEKLHYIVGDVMKTLSPESCRATSEIQIPKKIAILRLDTDWYESSKIELEALYDRVVPRGVIIFDDYYHWDGQRRAVDDFFNKIGVKYEFININNGKTAVIIKK